MRLLALSLLFGAAIGCTGTVPQSLSSPTAAAPQWTELTSEHFVLRTNLAPTVGQYIILDLEQSRAALADLAFPYSKRPEGRIDVLVTRTEAELVELRGPAPAARGAAQPPIAWAGDLSETTRQALLAQLTDRFVHFYFSSAPAWLAEGLAQYYSTMSFENGKAVIGRMPSLRACSDRPWNSPMRSRHWRYNPPSGWSASTAELRAASPADFAETSRDLGECTGEHQQVRRNQAGAWALVHYLSTGPHRHRFHAYMRSIGLAVTPEDAWKGAFGTLDEGALEAGFSRFLSSHERIVLRTSYELPEVLMAPERTLPADEVHLLWAASRVWGDEVARRKARADLDAALAINVHSADARLWLGRLERVEGNFAGAERVLYEALALRPDDETILSELVLVHTAQLDRTPAAERDYSRADALVPELQLHAKSSYALNNLAWYLVGYRDRADEALPYARAAIRDFSCWQCFDTLAVILAKQGDQAGAYRMQSIAVNVAPDGLVTADMLGRWKQYRRAASVQSEVRSAALARPALAVPRR